MQCFVSVSVYQGLSLSLSPDEGRNNPAVYKPDRRQTRQGKAEQQPQCIGQHEPATAAHGSQRRHEKGRGCRGRRGEDGYGSCSNGNNAVVDASQHRLGKHEKRTTPNIKPGPKQKQ